jgi:hypothetical protein
MPDDHLPLPDDLHYLPADWLDECVPPPLAVPDEFIFRDGDRWILRPANDDDVEPHLVRELRAGDIIQFCEHRHFGSFTLDLREDGSWEIDGDYPAYANCFALRSDFDTIANSVPDLITNAEIEPDTCADIEIWWWSEASTPWQFVAEGDSSRFVKFVGVA